MKLPPLTAGCSLALPTPAQVGGPRLRQDNPLADRAVGSLRR